jgi:hypothetical protein
MNKIQLLYLLKYAEVYKIDRVLDAIEASEVSTMPMDYIMLFLDYYFSMIEYHMEYEVFYSMEHGNMDFMHACAEWDL